jgi:hypothetical protein
MNRAEYLKGLKPDLIVDLTLYPTERGAERFPSGLAGAVHARSNTSEEMNGFVGTGGPYLVTPFYRQARPVAWDIHSYQEIAR